ncbi:phosphoenolpyruvate--protein phosphotransferase, partial [Candidatus Kapabacteria bacterium]|nr:phosphoenolpyruvate--protein phosphotransferase [Candidatus Kapabacteria bacterium]
IDFYSIGTNDLMQYFFAADRTNDKLSELFNFNDTSFYIFLKEIILKAKKQGKPISVCGELAQSEKQLEILLGIGIEQVSVSSSKILEIKNIIRNTNLKSTKKQTSKLLKS